MKKDKVENSQKVDLQAKNIDSSSYNLFFENTNSIDLGFGKDEWFTTEEAALFLKVSPHYLRNLTSNGYVPYQKLKSRNRYRKSDLITLLSATRKGGLNGIQV